MNTQTKDAILERLASGPEAQAIAATLDAEALAERRRLKEEIATLRAEIETTLPPLRAREDKALAAVRAAEEALQQARQRYQQAAGETRSAVSRHDHERDVREARLIETAPEGLTEFQRSLDALAQQVRRRGPVVEVGGKHWLTGRALPDTSNYPQIVQILNAIRESREAAEAMKMEALEADEIEATIIALRATIETAGTE